MSYEIFTMPRTGRSKATRIGVAGTREEARAIAQQASRGENVDYAYSLDLDNPHQADSQFRSGTEF